MEKEPIYTSKTVHKGDMRCHTVYTDKGEYCTTDIPEALGGLGEYPTPGRMLAACMASCMLSMIAHTGKTKGFETTGISVRAGVKELKSGISTLYFHIEVPVPTTPEARRFMKGAVASCPVGHAISEKVEREFEWSWLEE